MRKWTHVLLGAVGLLSLGLPAAAQGLGYLPERLTWRTQTAGVNANGYVDSSTVRAAAVSAHADTTAPIAKGWWPIPSGVGGVTAVDTLTYFTFVFQRSKETTLTEGEDSIYVCPQVSWDGTNWFTTGAGATGTGLDVNGAASVAGFSAATVTAILENGTSGTFHGNASFVSQGATGFHAPDPTTATVTIGYRELFGWPYLRFLVEGDYNGEYEGFVYHWVPVATSVPPSP